MSSLFENSTITVTRKVKTASTNLGTPTYSTVIILSELGCCLQRESSVIEYGLQGQTTVSDYMLSCREIIDLKSDDVITDQDGQVYTVIGKPYFGTIVPHTEALLKLGVTN